MSNIKWKSINGRQKMKRRYFLIFVRIFVSVFFIFLDISLVVFAFLRYSVILDLYLAVSRVAGIILSYFIINSNIHPEEKISWIFPLTTVPSLGVFIYLSVGDLSIGYNLMKKKRIKKRREYYRMVEDIKETENDIFFLLSQNKYPFFDAECFKWYGMGDEAFEAIINELELAKGSIYLEFYYLSPGKMLDRLVSVLSEKAEMGIDVRIIYDDVASSAALSADSPSRFEALGIKCRVFSRASLYLSSELHFRDHRKIVVIDKRTVFIGGVNISDEYMNKSVGKPYWKDCVLMMKGSVAKSYNEMFLSMFEENYRPSYEGCLVNGKGCNEREKAVQPFFSLQPEDASAVTQAYFRIISGAERYVWIMTPYLVPGYEIISALVFASESGVDVRIITPHLPDKKYVHSVTRSHYSYLLSHGVKIYEYTKGFVHSKVAIADGRLCVVGSGNLDFRSMHILTECGAAIYSHKVIDEIKKDFENTFSESSMIEHKDLNKSFALTERVIAFILKPFETLL